MYPMWQRQMREPLRFGKRLVSEEKYLKVVGKETKVPVKSTKILDLSQRLI